MSIFDAITATDNELVKKLIAQGKHCNVFNTFSFSRSPLAHATTQGNLDAMRLLLDAGVSAAEEEFATCPLFIAIHTRNVAAAQLLLDYRENADRRSNEGDNLLFNCASRKIWQPVRLLIERGASVNCTNRDSNSPLILAAGMTARAVMEILIECGADIHYQNKEGESALHWAALEADLECVELLLRAGADPTMRTKAGHDVLEFALRYSVVWTPEKGEEELGRLRTTLDTRGRFKVKIL